MSHPSPSADSASTAAHTRRRTVWIALGVAAVGAVAAAATVLLLGPGSPGDAAATFVTQPGFRPGATASCLDHQTDLPNAAYQGGANGQTLPELTFLAYYTSAGRKPFCDGQPATDNDKAWARLYVQLTTNPGNVATILG